MVATNRVSLNPEQAQQLADKFKYHEEVENQALIKSMNDSARRMEFMIGDLNTAVKGMDWEGRVASRFDNDWESEFKPGMKRMQQSIEEFLPVLDRMKLGLMQVQRDVVTHRGNILSVDGQG